MPGSPSRFFTVFKIVILAGAAVTAFVVAGAQLPRLLTQPDSVGGPPALRNVLLPSPQPLQPFALRDGSEKAFDLGRLRGHWTMFFFGYTSCPDICPTALTILRDVADVLDDDARVQYVFVTVDPARDDPAQVGAYAAFFHPHFIGVGGEPADIEALKKQFNVMSVRNDSGDPQAYTISHSSSIMVVDPEARLVGTFSPPHKAARIVEQFQVLQDYFRG